MIGKYSTVILVCLLAIVVAGAPPTPTPYDESADAKTDLAKAFAAATAKEKPVMIVFGANWCPDCRALDAAMNEQDLQDLVERYFELVKVDIGNWDKNIDVLQQFDNPIEGGIPSLVIVNNDHEILFMTKGGQLASARSMGHETLLKFFRELVKLSS